MSHTTASVSRTTTVSSDLTIAAGGLVWRQRNGEREIAVVHRRRYGGDYTLPKGKIKPNETPLACALREVREETGYAAEPVDFAGPVSYAADGGPKLVLFWTMRATQELDTGVHDSEVEEVLWLDPKKAFEQLSYPLERDLMVGALGDEVITPGARVRSFLSRWKLRRPARLGTRRRGRLEAAIVTTEYELQWRAYQTNQAREAWAETARLLLHETRSFLRRGMIEEGWHALQVARRLEIWAMDNDERLAHANGLRAEADAKLSKWRHTTVTEDLAEKVPSRAALRHAQSIMDEHSQNVYRRLTVSAEHLSLMAAIVGLLLIAILYLSSVVALPVDTAQTDQFELTVYILIFGMLGGAVSAMLPRDEGGQRLPEQIAAAVFNKLRPVFGAASALILYLFVNSGLFMSGFRATQGAILLFAFAAGFSERLIVRAIARVADSISEEGGTK